VIEDHARLGRAVNHEPPIALPAELIERFRSIAERLVSAHLEVISADERPFEIGQLVAHVYMSFKGDGTFGKHWDTHDVFAIQLLGRKRWRIFAPTFPLPLTYQTNDRSGHECPDEPELEITMEEGDMLYLPRGWWHHVIPLDVGSFHLSVGTYSPTLYDDIMMTSAKYVEQQAAARRAFSPSDYRERLSEILRQLPDVLSDPARAAAFERETIGREPLDAELNLNLFLEPRAHPLTGTAVLRLTTFHTPTLEGGQLPVNGALLSLDTVGQAIVAVLRDCTALDFAALCARLEDTSPDAVRRAVLDLARHDIVTIQA
jgi:ribosomal protein L16 Arg81 hydroxylase